MLNGPVFINFGQARARMVAIPHQLEHGLQPAVTAIAVPAHSCQFQWNTHAPWVTESKQIGPFDDQYRHSPRIIGMHQRIGQSLAQRLMQRRIVHPLAVLQLKRHF